MYYFDEMLAFESKHPYIYDISVNGVCLYAGLRDGVNSIFFNRQTYQSSSVQEKKGKVFIRRILDGMLKTSKLSHSETVVFTSSVYRRDKGRNLNAEFLLEKYTDGAIFEWPSRDNVFDSAYFTDPNRSKYVPLDWYLVKSKIYRLFHKKEYQSLVEEGKKIVDEKFANASDTESNTEKLALDYIKNALPHSYAETVITHKLFKKYFRKYKSIKYAIDFWGSGRESIIPVLSGNPQSIELQHGILTSIHPGYIYPDFLKESKAEIFKRKILVYGEATKELLSTKSIFRPDQLEIIGNPRIIMHKKLFPLEEKERNLILFTSQPIEQDGIATGYYERVIIFLNKVQQMISTDDKWKKYTLGIKLHPRETNDVVSMYEKKVPGCIVYDRTSQLFDLLNETYLQLTRTSTSLYEGAMFGSPTVCISFNGLNLVDNYGFPVVEVNTIEELETEMNSLLSSDYYNEKLDYYKTQTIKYM